MFCVLCYCFKCSVFYVIVLSVLCSMFIVLSVLCSMFIVLSVLCSMFIVLNVGMACKSLECERIKNS